MPSPLRPLPLLAASRDTAFGEFLPLSDRHGVPVLVRLAQRPWGALASLPAAEIKQAGFAGGWVGGWFAGGVGVGHIQWGDASVLGSSSSTASIEHRRQ